MAQTETDLIPNRDDIPEAMTTVINGGDPDEFEIRRYISRIDQGDPTTLEIYRSHGEETIFIKWYVPLTHTEPSGVIVPDNTMISDPGHELVIDQANLTKFKEPTEQSELGTAVHTTGNEIIDQLNTVAYPLTEIDPFYVMQINDGPTGPCASLITATRVQ